MQQRPSILKHVGQFVHLCLIAFLAIWMGIFAPMMCKYHGLLWGNSAHLLQHREQGQQQHQPAAHTHHEHHHHQMANEHEGLQPSTAAQLPASPSPSPSGTNLTPHTPVTTSTIMSAFVVVFPTHVVHENPTDLIIVLDNSILFPDLPSLIPPEQPPRFVLSV